MTSLELACTVTALAIAAGARSSDPKLEKEKKHIIIFLLQFFFNFIKEIYLQTHEILLQNHVLFQPSGNGL